MGLTHEVLTTEGILMLLCSKIPINYKVVRISSQQECGLNRNPFVPVVPRTVAVFWGLKSFV